MQYYDSSKKSVLQYITVYWIVTPNEDMYRIARFLPFLRSLIHDNLPIQTDRTDDNTNLKSKL